MVLDIVCGRAIETSGSVWASWYHGQMYFFCSLECHEKFELEPEDYLPLPPATSLPDEVTMHIVN